MDLKKMNEIISCGYAIVLAIIPLLSEIILTSSGTWEREVDVKELQNWCIFIQNCLPNRFFISIPTHSEWHGERIHSQHVMYCKDKLDSKAR